MKAANRIMARYYNHHVFLYKFVFDYHKQYVFSLGKMLKIKRVYLKQRVGMIYLLILLLFLCTA